MGQAARQRNKDTEDGDRKEDRGTARGKKRQGAGQRWRKQQQGKRKRGRKREREQERERKIRTAGSIEIAKKVRGGQQDGEGVEKNRGREQDRGM